MTDTVREADAIVESNKAFYEVCARDYDQGREHFYQLEGKRVARDLQALRDECGAVPGTVLDVGCGTGFFSLAAARSGAKKVHCLDIDVTFLQATRTRLETQCPEVETAIHEADLGAFVSEREEDLSGIDLFILGSVLQHVPDCAEILAQLARRTPGAAFYITSTRCPARGRRLLENGLIALDYKLHKVIRRPKKRTGLPSSKVTLEVDAESLERMFQECGFRTRLCRYTSFHTGFFSRLHRLLARVMPSLGTYFTLVAVPSSGPERV